MIDPRRMSVDAVLRELRDLWRRWDATMLALQESGGASGSPGEWIRERVGELEHELKRRAVGMVANG